MSSNAAELMDHGSTTQNGVIVNFHFTGKLTGITHDHIISDDTIVCYMAISHQQTITTYNGFPFRGSTPVNSYEFTQGGIIADNSQRILTLEFQILRHGTNDCSGENGTVFSDTYTFEDGYIGTDTGTFTDDHIFINCYKRFDHYGRCNFCIRMNVC